MANSRKLYVVGNWKMYKTAVETDNFREEFVKEIEETKPTNVDIGICANYLVLERLKNWFSLLNHDFNINIDLGAQNMHYQNEGAFTGEISAPMLKSFNIDLVIIGHSERREYFNDTDETINQKIKNALENDMRVILCVGESEEIRNNNEEEAFVKEQINKAFDGVSDLSKIMIAYEPIWAIGTGKTASADDAEKMCGFIRGIINEKFGEEVSKNIRILYGGSVKEGNSVELFSKENIDGGLIGGASLNVEEFTNIIKTANEISK